MTSEFMTGDQDGPVGGRGDLLAEVLAAAKSYGRVVAAARAAGLPDSAIADASAGLPRSSISRHDDMLHKAFVQAQRSETQRLAASGLTEHDIAARLGISRRRVRRWTFNSTV